MMVERDPSGITESDFLACMRPPGQPLILRRGASSWSATRLWTFTYFALKYRSDPLLLSDCLIHPSVSLTVTLKEYLDYVERPEGTRLAALAQSHHMSVPFYAYGYKPFVDHPELRAHFRLPSYVRDWCENMPPPIREGLYPHGQPWLLFSSPGARSVLHRDSGATIAWFAQIRGSKRFIVHPPHERPFLYDGRVDPTRPDLSRFPDYARAWPIEFVLNATDLMFLPQDWYHFVRTETHSITLTGNIVNHINFGEYVQYAYGDALPAFLAAMPIPPGIQIATERKQSA